MATKASRRRYSRNPEVAQSQREGRTESVKGPLVSNGGGAAPKRAAAPRTSTSDYESEHYGGNANSSSDLERMRSNSGLATGRPSPRVPQRTNAANSTLVDRGLASSGDVDANQGRLLSHAQMGSLTKSDAEMSAQTGIPYRRPAGRGFLTGSGQSTQQPYATYAAARAAGNEKGMAATSKRQGEVLRAAAERLGTSTPILSAMRSRAQRESDNPTHWYAEGAANVIHHEVMKSGMGANPNGFNAMRRVVALTSPQKAWDSGHVMDGNYKADNADVAGHLVRHLNRDREAQGTAYDPQKSADAFRMKGVRTPLVEGQNKAVRRSVAEHLDSPTHEDPKLATEAQKVRNFDLALAAGSDSKWGRRQAAQPYTSDTHDARAMGDKDYAWIGSPSSGGYEFAAMTGRRGAMRQSVKARKDGKTPRTPSEYQEDIWNNQRPVKPPYIHKKVPNPVTGKNETSRQSLFHESSPGKQMQPTPFSRPYTADETETRAKQMGPRFSVDTRPKQMRAGSGDAGVSTSKLSGRQFG